LLMGLFASLVQMSNTRLVMAIIPVMGRNHFFAIYSVLGSLAMGLAPIGWGLLIDAIGGWQASWLGIIWNRYAVFFAAVAGVFGVALALALRLRNPRGQHGGAVAGDPHRVASTHSRPAVAPMKRRKPEPGGSGFCREC